MDREPLLVAAHMARGHAKARALAPEGDPRARLKAMRALEQLAKGHEATAENTKAQRLN
jgi:hypothetical protein